MRSDSVGSISAISRSSGFPPTLWTPWHREERTRNTLVSGIAGLDLRPEDVILFSDVDEIPRAARVREYAQSVADGKHLCCVFEQALSYYHVNLRAQSPWHGTRMVRYEGMPSFHELRSMIGTLAPDGGWHFCRLGDAEQIREQVRAAVHFERNCPPFTKLDHIRTCVREGRDLFDEEVRLRTVPLNETFPRYLQENTTRFASFIRPLLGP